MLHGAYRQRAGKMKTFRQYISHLLHYKVIHIIFHSNWTYKLRVRHGRTLARITRGSRSRIWPGPALGTVLYLFVSRGILPPSLAQCAAASSGAGPCRPALYRAPPRRRYAQTTHVTRRPRLADALAHSEYRLHPCLYYTTHTKSYSTLNTKPTHTYNQRYLFTTNSLQPKRRSTDSRERASMQHWYYNKSVITLFYRSNSALAALKVFDNVWIIFRKCNYWHREIEPIKWWLYHDSQ